MSNKQSLQEILGDNWRDYFSKEETIKDLVKTLDVQDCVFKNIVTRYSINDDRLAIISTVENKDKHLEKIIIDVKTGVPTWEQMMDVVYNMGSDCDTKIVIFDGANNPNDFCNIMDIGFGFSSILSNSRVTIYIVLAKVLRENKKRTRLKYEVIDKPSSPTSWPYPDIPQILSPTGKVKSFPTILLSTFLPVRLPKSSQRAPNTTSCG